MHPGDVIGDRFEIEKHVATGGMGQVFRARDVQSGEIVAVKMLRGDLRELDRRFDREGQALARLSHPGIVRYVAHGLAASGEPFLAMEWLEGEELAGRLVRGRLALQDSLALVTRVAEAVHAAHARDIVHRDLKPSNIFLVNGRLDQVKVLDFGIARFATEARLTRTGMMIGTPGYMAPEQAAADRPVDARADVFSLGCVLFECLTGVFAFAAEHPMALLAKVLFAEPQRLRDVLPTAPRAVDELISRMLAKDPAERPPHGGAVAEALAALGSVVDAGAVSQPSIALTLDEQRMFSVVMVGGESGLLDGEGDDTIGGDPTFRQTRPLQQGWMGQTLTRGASAWGGRLERLRDGSAAVALGGSGLVTDQAAQAARCALWLRPLVPGPMALATGRGDRAGQLPAAETIDRAAKMLLLSPPAAGAAAEGIAIDEVTARLLDARFDVRERGTGYVLLGERELAEGTRMLLGRPTPCVGRDLELRALEQLFEECTEEPAARAAIVTATAGTGKSRLAQELLRTFQARDARTPVWSCRGESHRAGSAFNLLSQLVRSACGIQSSEPLDVQRDKLVIHAALSTDASERRRLAEFLGEIVGAPFPDDSLALRAARQDPQLMNERMRTAFLDLLEAETAAHPVVMVVEDVHWGDLPSLQFLDAALRDLSERPLFILALGRPEVHTMFPELWAERAIQEIPLKQLGKKASERLVRHMLGDDAKRSLVDRLVRLSDGNAFYLEELIRAAAEGESSHLPETVVAMVQARLDALDDEARRILRAASVFGEVFWVGAVTRLLGATGPMPETGRKLAELTSRELINSRKQSRFPDEEEYTFRHALLHEGAYAMLTDEDRVLGHRLAGEWLEQHGEQDPIVLAEHFERGGARARAGHHYLRAAVQATQGSDMAAGIARAKRALDCGLPEELRVRCLGMLCELRYYSMALQGDALSDAQEVVRLAQRGSSPWSQGMFIWMLCCLQTQDLEQFEVLVELAGDTPPAPNAVTAWTLCVDLGILMLDLVGRSRRANLLLPKLAAGVGAAGDDEPIALALFHGMLGVRMAYADEDPMSGLEHGEMYLQISGRLGYKRYASDAKLLKGMNRWCLGLYAGTERMLIEETLSDSDAGIISSWRPFVLAWMFADSGNFVEARRWASGLVSTGRTRGLALDEGRGHWVLAEVLRRADNLDGAAAEIEAALAILRLAAPLDLPGVLASLAAVCLAQGRIAEARAAAEEGLAKHEAMAACGFFRGAFLRLVHAECLEAAGDQEAAKSAIAAARARLLAIAAKISDPEHRKSFFEVVPENRRTLELARRWVGPGEPGEPG